MEWLGIAGAEHGLETTCNQTLSVEGGSPITKLHSRVTRYSFHACVSRSFVGPFNVGHNDGLVLLSTCGFQEAFVLHLRLLGFRSVIRLCIWSRFIEPTFHDAECAVLFDNLCRKLGQFFIRGLVRARDRSEEAVD